MSIKRPESNNRNKNRPERINPEVWKIAEQIANIRKPTWYAGRITNVDPNYSR
jgi:hypothetical protein